MTPRKKSSAKSSSKGKGQGRKKKSAPEQPGNRPVRNGKPSPAKIRHSSRRSILFAFLLGLAVSAAFFLLLRSSGDQSAAPAMNEGIRQPVDVSVVETQGHPLPKIPAGEIAKARAKKVRDAQANGTIPRAPGIPPSAPSAGAGSSASHPNRISGVLPPANATQKQRFAEKAAPQSANGTGKASALIDLKSLPYEESLEAGLEERVRQADYALIQAAWLRKLPATSLRLAEVEERRKGQEVYHFQIIDILPDNMADEYIATLEECLSAWAESATLQKSGPDEWIIKSGGILTHLIRLYPDRNELPPLSDIPPLPGERPEKDRDKPRVRKPGEPARLTIVIDDLGANPSALKLLMGLNYPVTCAFWPHGAHTRKGAAEAYAAGHEILVHQPMEPLGYPEVKPGPNVLLVGMSEDKIRDILHQNLAAVPYAMGLNNHMGSNFTQNIEGVSVVLEVLREKGLFMLDSLTHGNSVFMKRAREMGIEHYKRDVFLDVVPSRASILNQLKQAERIALLTGSAVAIGHPKPETLAALKEWQRLRNKKVHIVPLRQLGNGNE